MKKRKCPLKKKCSKKRQLRRKNKIILQQYRQYRITYKKRKKLAKISLSKTNLSKQDARKNFKKMKE